VAQDVGSEFKPYYWKKKKKAASEHTTHKPMAQWLVQHSSSPLWKADKTTNPLSGKST
jgi:hypothetical protein